MIGMLFTIRNRLLAGENVNAEEVYATPEVQHVLAMRTPGSSMDTGDLLNLQKRNCTIRIRLTPLNVT